MARVNPARLPMNLRQKMRRNTFLIICLLGVTYVGISVANVEGYLGDQVNDSLKLGLIVVLCVVGYLSGREFFHFTRTKTVFLLAMIFLIMFHITELTEEFAALRAVPLFGEVTLAKRAFETILMIGCVCLFLGGIYLSVSEINKARKHLDSDVRFLEVTGRIDRIIRQADDLEQMMRDILETVLSVFECDRAFLLYPCDPESQYWQVPMECTRPEYPGAHALGRDLPMNPTLSDEFRAVLASDGPVSAMWPEGQGKWDPDGRFGVRSLLIMAMRPKEGKPWAFGIHQCSHARVWTEHEQKLFEAIGRRLSEGLSTLLFFRRLCETEERNRKVLDTMQDCLVIADPEGRVIHANAAFCQQYGYRLEELIGMHATQLIRPDYHPVFEQFREEVRATGNFKGETVDVRKDGTSFDVEIRGAAIELGGKMCLLAVIRDVTQRKRAEQALRNYEAQLRSLASELSLTEERARRRIAVGVHDGICQQLAMMKLELKALAQLDEPAMFRERAEELCRQIDHTLDDARTLTFELSDPVLYEVGLAAATESWLETQLRGKHGIAYELDADPDLPEIDDELRAILFRDLRELLTNIIKHAKAKIVEVSLQKIGSDVRIVVADDGVGFEDVAWTALDRKPEGFGLFSVREHLRHLGGCLDIESDSGKGTRIIMTVPIRHEQAVHNGPPET